MIPCGRAVVDGVLPPALCEELAFIHSSLAVRGYRPHVTSVTLHDLVAAEPAFLVPLVEARRRVWEATEAALGRELELHPEFTGLLSWHPGAAIGWHHDSNRPYLKQREVAAVAYLNTQSVHFTGGTFLFQAQPALPQAQEGPSGIPADEAPQPPAAAPVRVTPAMGRLVAYTAGAENTHCVEAVETGCRRTLVMWFTSDPAFREDGSVLRGLLAACRGPGGAACRGGGLPDTMYLDEGGGDARVAFLERHGLEVCAAGTSNPAAEQGDACSSALQGAGCSSPRQGLEVRCQAGAAVESCRQHSIHFDTLAGAVAAVSFMLWRQSRLLAPLVEVVAPESGSGQHAAAGGLAEQGTSQYCACSHLQLAVAGFSVYKSRLDAMLRDVVGCWESAGYLGAG